MSKTHSKATALAVAVIVMQTVVVGGLTVVPVSFAQTTTDVSLTSQAPVLTTDKADYEPGETASILGSFFNALQDIVVRVFGNSGVGNHVTDTSVTVTPDENGVFTYDYHLDNFYRPLYTVIASTLAGIELARTTFTDAPGASVDDFSQCSNDQGTGYTTGNTGCRWTNGNLQPNNSKYYEGDATVQRVTITGLTGGAHTVVFQYQTTKGGKHAYDFLTNDVYSETWVTSADLCEGLTGFPSCVGQTENFSPDIPHDPLNILGGGDTNQNFKIRNGVITGVGVPTLVSGSYAADSLTNISVDFTVASSTCADVDKNGKCPVFISFGAHISTQDDWGTGASAVNINGSPYHVKVVELDGASTGNRDNQMQANTIVVPQATGLISGVKFNDANGNGVQDNGELGLAGWTITLGGDAASTTVTNLSGAYSFSGLADGSYTVCETQQGGWTQTFPTSGASCTGGLGYSVTITSGNTSANNNFGNTQQAHLTLVKTVTNNDGGTTTNTSWTLTATGPTTITGTTGSGAVTNVAVTAGDYSLSENGGPSGYAASNWVCVGGSQNGATVTLSAGQSATCTITNDDIAPTLTLVKTVVNDNGGEAVENDFQGKIDGGNVSWNTTTTVSAGNHTASEVNLPGYTAGNWGGDCNADGSITLALDQHATCTITNDDNQSYVIVDKTVINDNGGSAVANDFNLTVNGNAALDEVAVPVNPGVYTAGETNLTGYTAGSWGTDCDANGSVTVGLGETKICTITNDDDAPSLTLVKEVVNDNGGEALPEDWTLTASGYDSNSPDAGTYTLSESGGPGGYTQTSLTCDNAQGQVTSVTLGLGESVTCTFVNDDDAPSLTLVKVVVNDNGGTATSSDWTLTASGYDANLPQIGTYNLSESNGPNGYTQTSLTCDNAQGEVTQAILGLGEHVTCTFINDDIKPTLTLVKNVTNDNGGTLGVSDFPLFVDATQVTSGIANGFDAGSYTASETNQPGYTAGSWTGDCAADGSVTLDVGDEKTCTIINDDEPGTLHIVKIVDNGNTGATTTADAFSFSVNDGGNESFESDGQNDKTVDAGNYTVTEPSVTGYETSYDNCANIAIPNGGEATCTITNTAIAPTLTLVKHVTNDNGGTAVVADFVLKVDGNSVVSGEANTETVGAHTASEVSLPGYTAGDWGGDCAADGAVSLALGDEKTCDITNNDDPAEIHGSKFEDVNGNGVWDNGEPALEGWTIVLNPGNVTTTTDVNGEYAFTGLSANVEYTVTEENQGGWTQTTTDPAGITLENGGSETGVDFGNFQNVTLSGFKFDDTNGDHTKDTGEPKLAGWTITLDKDDDGLVDATTTTNGSGNWNFGDLGPGTYRIREVQQDGWMQTRPNDTYGGAGHQADGSYLLTVTSGNDIDDREFGNFKLATIVVHKDVTDPDGGDIADSHEFTVELNGADGKTIAEGTDATYDNLAPGSYTVTEVADADYDLVSITPANVEPTSGSVTDVYVVNKQKKATITLVKDVVAPDGTTDVSDSHEFSVTVNGETKNFAEGNDAVFTVNPGSYTAVEDADLNYTLVGYSPSDTAEVPSNGSATITVINKQNLSHLIVIKHVVNDNGGEAVAGDFTMNVSGTEVSNSSFNGEEDPGTDVTLWAGEYSATEDSVFGYASSSSADCSGTIGIGETKTCTITNDDVAPTLTLIKHVVNDNGGTLEVSDVPLFVDATQVTSGDANILDAGSYTTSETNQEGYSASDWSGDCAADGSVTLAVGENKTCEITNDDIPAKLTIIKDSDPNDSQDFSFSGTLGNFTLDNDEGVQDILDANEWENSQAFDGLSTGVQYTVTEGAEPPYWDFVGVSCVDNTNQGAAYPATANGQSISVELPLAGDVTCTFTNHKNSPTRTQGFWQTHTNYTSQIFSTYFGAGMQIGSSSHKGLITNTQSNGNSQLFGAFYANIAKTTNGKGKNAQRSEVDKARMQLLQQLVSAKLNCAAFGCDATAQAAITTADVAYAGSDVSAILASSGVLDVYNNSGDTIIINGVPGKATPKTSQSWANLGFWDTP